MILEDFAVFCAFLLLIQQFRISRKCCSLVQEKIMKDFLLTEHIVFESFVRKGLIMSMKLIAQSGEIYRTSKYCGH